MLRETTPSPSQPRPARQSVLRRVFIGISVIVIAFAGLISYSIFLYRQTASEMSLLNSTYLPLTIGTSEIRSTQVVFNTLMDRLAEDPDQALTRDWLNAARQYRPATLSRLTYLITTTLRDNPGISSDERSFLEDTRQRLRDVRRRYRSNESRFMALFSALDTGQSDDVMAQIENLKRSERLLNKVLSGIGADVKQHITHVSQEAVLKANTATMFLAVMSGALFLVGIGVIITTLRVLAPLKKLQEAVSRVSAGDLDTNIQVFRDDEIGALATRFNAMTRALLDRDRMLIRQEQLATTGKIAAQVTHEIRNPLSSMGLNADLLRDELNGNGSLDEARALLTAIQDEIERLTGVTESYLQFARLPSPDPRFNDPAEFIESTVAFMNAELSDAAITVTTDFIGAMELWVFDRGQLRQVLINLLRNAMEAMPEGGTILIRAEIASNELIICISDNGPGVSDDIRPHIFEAFFTTRSAGSGLGLAMVRQICLAHGGRIEYDNREGGGSVFSLYLPRTQSRPIEVSHESHKNPQ